MLSFSDITTWWSDLSTFKKIMISILIAIYLIVGIYTGGSLGTYGFRLIDSIQIPYFLNILILIILWPLIYIKMWIDAINARVTSGNADNFRNKYNKELTDASNARVTSGNADNFRNKYNKELTDASNIREQAVILIEDYKKSLPENQEKIRLGMYVADNNNKVRDLFNPELTTLSLTLNDLNYNMKFDDTSITKIVSNTQLLQKKIEDYKKNPLPIPMPAPTTAPTPAPTIIPNQFPTSPSQPK